MADIDFDVIEDAIIEAIKTSTDPDMSYVATVETYAGQLSLNDLNDLAVNFPAVFVMLGDMPIEWIDEPNYNFKPAFRVLCAAQDARGLADAKAGAYQIVKDVLKVLTNKNLGLDIERLTPTRVALAAISQQVAVYGAEFQTNFDKGF